MLELVSALYPSKNKQVWFCTQNRRKNRSEKPYPVRGQQRSKRTRYFNYLFEYWRHLLDASISYGERNNAWRNNRMRYWLTKRLSHLVFRMWNGKDARQEANQKGIDSPASQTKWRAIIYSRWNAASNTHCLCYLHFVDQDRQPSNDPTIPVFSKRHHYA